MAHHQLPVQHLSLRVPWHDSGWQAAICTDPLANGACLRLGRIAEERDDRLELRLAGTPWEQLAPDQLPPCSAERAGFMSASTRTVVKQHPYAGGT